MVGFESDYHISEYGQLKRIAPGLMNHYNGHIQKPFINHQGYHLVKISVNRKEHSKLAHRLVAEAFIPNPLNKPVVNHIDANTGNNHVSNLEWCTIKENNHHAIRMGLMKPAYGSKQGSSKLTDIKAINIKHCRGSISSAELAKFYNVHKSTVKAIWNGRTWKHLFQEVGNV